MKFIYLNETNCHPISPSREQSPGGDGMLKEEVILTVCFGDAQQNPMGFPSDCAACCQNMEV